jgi:hypothetical protein
MTSITNKPPPSVLQKLPSAAATPAPKTAAPTATAAPAGWKPAGQAQASAAAAPLPTDPKKMDIVCPVLASLVKEGKVKMNPDGTMKLNDLVNSPGLNLTGPMKTTLTGIGFLANKPGDVAHNMIHHEMNVLDLRAGMEKHPSDSSVLTAGKFDQAKFDALVSHADHGIMTPDAVASAIAANTMRDIPQVGVAKAYGFGAHASAVEFGALLTVFGKTDPATGKFGIPVEEMRALFQDKTLPKTGNPTLIDTGAMNASIQVKVDAQLAGVAFRSLSTPSGVSAAGEKLTNGARSTGAAEMASVGAGKAAACPHMNGSIKPPQPNDTVNAHTQAGLTEN